jgi:hypothetical protein
MKRITFDLQSVLFRSLRIYCCAEDLSVSEVCRQALQQFLYDKGAHHLDILDNRSSDQTQSRLNE